MSRLEKLREMPCACWDDPARFPHAHRECVPEVDAHHRTGAGMALKADDSKTFPLCHKHHMDFHAGRGVFRDWNKVMRRVWQEQMIEKYDRILCDPEAF